MAFGQEAQEVRLAVPSPVKYFTPAVIVLLVLMIAGYALLAHLHDWTLGAFALDPRAVVRGRIWQVVTYPFVDGGCGLVWHGLVVLFVGSAIEREWRARSLLFLWLFVAVVCAVLWTAACLLFNRPVIWNGAHGCAYGLIGAFGLVFRKRRILFFFWGMEAQFLALILIGIGIVIGIAMPITWIWVGGAPVAYLYIKSLWRIMSRSSGSGGTPPAPSRRFADLD